MARKKHNWRVRSSSGHVQRVNGGHKQALVDARYWIAAGAKCIEVQERNPMGGWITRNKMCRRKKG